MSAQVGGGIASRSVKAGMGVPMPSFRYLELPASGVASLAWRGDVLVDRVGGGAVYGLDGSFAPAQVRYAYRFDSLVQSADGRYAVIYERRGTKGVVLRDERVIREINRSFYHAEVYDYPITLFRLAEGREVLAHCPDDYNRIEIELVETGERLTGRGDASQALDVFHSGLAASPDGAWLMSAGWMWHPYLGVSFYPLAESLTDPCRLDRTHGLADCAEIASAAFIDEDRAVLASAPHAESFDEDLSELRLRPGEIGIYRFASETWDSVAPFGEPAGRLLAIDADHVLSLYECPKLIHVPTGRVLERWPGILSGLWDGCLSASVPPPMAWDPGGRRLAIAAEDRIQILALQEA